MSFIKLARQSQVPPGKMICVLVQGRRILLANVGGSLYATDDRCTHEDASLSRGVLRGEWVKCPLHGSRFNLRTGEVAEDPARDNLRVYPVRVDGDDVLVDLD